MGAGGKEARGEGQVAGAQGAHAPVSHKACPLLSAQERGPRKATSEVGQL